MEPTSTQSGTISDQTYLFADQSGRHIPQDASRFAQTADPINRVEWMHWSSLTANDYNPNVIQRAEMNLLQNSILTTGWVQPVLHNAGIIVDGFHRWWLSHSSQELLGKYHGMLPAVDVRLGIIEAMLLTIRINRAKGTHAALRLSDVVRRLIDAGASPEQLKQGAGMTSAEVDLLTGGTVFTAKGIDSHIYSKAWKPKQR